MIETKIGKEVSTIKDSTTERALKDFVKTKAEIDALNSLLKEQKEVLANKAKGLLYEEEASTILFQSGDSAVKITLGIDAKIKDEEILRKILGERFHDLVNETITQKPEKKLKEMALEDDALLECIELKEKAPAVSVVKAS